MFGSPIVWMVNDYEKGKMGHLEIHNDHLVLHFTNTKDRKYPMDIPLLYDKLRLGLPEIEIGNLVFIIIPNSETGETELSILDERTEAVVDTAVVGRREFLDALYYWIG